MSERETPAWPEIIVDTEVDDIRDEVIGAVNVALNFLRRQGVEVSEALKIKHIALPTLFGSMISARANVVISREQSIRDVCEMQTRAFRESFGISLSEETEIEMRELMERMWDANVAELEKKHSEELEDADIFIYGEQVAEDFITLVSTFVHELWHLIESRAGVFKMPELMHEGTATYVQAKFWSEYEEEALSWNSETAQILYGMGADAVMKEMALSSEEGNLSLILNPEFRARLAKRFDADVLPAYFEASGRSNTDQEREQLLQDPAFVTFVADPSKENLLVALREKGLVMRARDFEAQDIGRYLNYLRGLIS